jgi:hypothetical protein
MRVDPQQSPEEKEEDFDKKLEHITKYVALALAFASTYYFFVKLVFL